MLPTPTHDNKPPLPLILLLHLPFPVLERFLVGGLWEPDAPFRPKRTTTTSADRPVSVVDGETSLVPSRLDPPCAPKLNQKEGPLPRPTPPFPTLNPLRTADRTLEGQTFVDDSK